MRVCGYRALTFRPLRSDYTSVPPPHEAPNTPTAVPEPPGTLAAALEHTTRLLKSDPVLAAEQAGEILKVAPQHPVARILLGVARREAGDPLAALKVLESLAAGHPKWAAAHYEMGLTLGALDRRDDSQAALRRAVALQPDMPDAWREI